MAGKLGKQPHVHDERDLLFANYRTKLPRRPKTFGHEQIGRGWGMLGNDSYGDCVFAGAAHETMLWNAAAGKTVRFTDTSVLGDYAAVTGFRPSDPSTDQGTVVRDALKYRQKTGIADALGHRHKIGAYVALDPHDLNAILEALYLFGAVGIGVQFPRSAMDQFDQGQEWKPVPGSPIEGGHYIPLVAERKRLECVTWGRIQEMSASFIDEFCDEAYALLSPEMLSSGKSLEGFDLAALRADLAALKA